MVEHQQVDVAKLDDLLGDRRVGIVKVDVEGHELAVLHGAERAIADRRIRDIIFEDHGEPPTPAMQFLENHGYEIFSLDHSLLGLSVRSGRERAAQLSGDDPSYLATADPDRAVERLRRRGWGALRLGPYGQTS